MKKTIINELSEIVDKDLISFHVPGHKLGKIYDRLGYTPILEKMYKMDTTEIIGTDNLHLPEGIIRKSQQRASEAFKSDYTYYLINGTTCGIQASIMAICYPKDKLIVNRDCHQSVINGCILGDIKPVYINSNINKENNIINGVNINEVINVINSNLDAKAILLTYPTYYGCTYDLKTICDYAHNKNMVVIIDEAHGAHLGLSDELPQTALEQGADIVIQSTHKTLPSFTQSSMIHTKGSRVDNNRLEVNLRMIQSSSPSYTLMASLELAVDIYINSGKELMNELLFNIYKFKDNIKSKIPINIYNDYDKTKIFIESKKLGLTGYKLEEVLRYKYNIQVELSNYYGILLICTIGNISKDFDILEKALIDIYNKCNDEIYIEEIIYPKDIPIQALTPREAFYKPKKSVKIYESVGKISGEYIIPYPPGISLLSPGEIISKDIIDYMLYCSKKGMSVNGIKDSSLEFIQIID
mgnify:CR=1 FL=1